MTLDLSYNPLLCPEWDYSLISAELVGRLSMAGLKPKRIWQRLKFPCPLLFSYSLASAVIFTPDGFSALFMSSYRAVCIGKLHVAGIQFSHWKSYFERGLLNRICGLKENGYFVCFCFTVQNFCNKTRWNTTNCSKNDHISCWGTLFCFFLIGTENVKTILSWMKPFVCIRAVMKTADEE